MNAFHLFWGIYSVAILAGIALTVFLWRRRDRALDHDRPRPRSWPLLILPLVAIASLAFAIPALKSEPWAEHIWFQYRMWLYVVKLLVIAAAIILARGRRGLGFVVAGLVVALDPGLLLFLLIGTACALGHDCI